MGDERCEIGPNVAAKGSLENQCSMSCNNNTSITNIPSTTHSHFSTNATNNNNNSNEKKDHFLPITATAKSIHHFSTSGSNNNNNSNDEHDRYPISSTTNTHPFSTNSNNKKELQDHFLPISTSNNNIQHFLSNATTTNSSSINNDHDRFLPISTNTKNTQNFSTKACSNNNCSSSSTTNNNKEQDRFLPIANVGRIMKKFIPGNGKISKDAKETVQECVSEFISFVTGEASDKCQREKRKTINGDDIIWAITTLGFEDYVTPLKQYLNKYRELEGEKLNVPKQQRLQQHDQQKPNMPYHNVYSSTSLLSQPSYVPNDQQFPLPFSQNSIQTQMPQHEHIDSVGNW